MCVTSSHTLSTYTLTAGKASRSTRHAVQKQGAPPPQLSYCDVCQLPDNEHVMLLYVLWCCQLHQWVVCLIVFSAAGAMAVTRQCTHTAASQRCAQCLLETGSAMSARASLILELAGYGRLLGSSSSIISRRWLHSVRPDPAQAMAARSHAGTRQAT